MRIVDSFLYRDAQRNSDGTFDFTQTDTIILPKLPPDAMIAEPIPGMIFYELDEGEKDVQLAYTAILYNRNGEECDNRPGRMDKPVSGPGRFGLEITPILKRREPMTYRLYVKLFDVSVPDGSRVADVTIRFRTR